MQVIESKGKGSNSSNDCSINDVVRVSVLVCDLFLHFVLKKFLQVILILILGFMELEFSRSSWF